MEKINKIRLVVDTQVGSARKQMRSVMDDVKKAMAKIMKENEAAMKAMSADVNDSVSQSVVYTIKRCLAGFDELNRLSVTSSGTTVKSLNEVQAAGEAFLTNVSDPLQDWAQNKFPTAMQMVYASMQGLNGWVDRGTASLAAYNQTWTTTGTALGSWNTMTPAALDSMDRMLRAVIRNRVEGDLANGTVSNLTTGTGTLGTAMGTTATLVETAAQRLVSAWGGSGSWFAENVVAPLGSGFTTLWSDIKGKAQSTWQGVQSVFGGAGSFFRNTFQNAWSRVMGVFSNSGQVFQDLEGGVLTGFKGIVNNLIDGINRVVTEPFQGVNNALAKLKNVSIGKLKPFALLNWSINMPRIPKLARGAVLPANRPFLAMVGDQRHGTNIEAPLATIQEAVAAVMEDYSAGNMAGHNATVQVLRQILEAVLGIRIGDEVIAAAMGRYNTRRSVMHGR